MGGGAGSEIVGAEVADGAGVIAGGFGGSVGGVADDADAGGADADGPGKTHAMVSGTADGAGVAGGVIGGRVGGPAGSFTSGGGSAPIDGDGGGAGDSAAVRRRAPHFSQNLDTAAFCAPHPSQNCTDSAAMTRSQAAQAPPNLWINRCSKDWAMSSSSLAAAGSP